MSQPLMFELRSAVAVVTINTPPYNRMTLEFMDLLEQRVAEIAANDAIRAVVLTAAGLENFSVGMDLKQLPEGIKMMGSAEAVFDQRLRVISAIENMQKPWVATLFGYCLGGGLEIPLGCHFRLAATEKAQIGLPELDLGAVPAWGGSARLAKCVGENHALDMILRAKKISGPRALEIGLANEVWPLHELKQAALNLADELAAMPALAVKQMMGVLVNSSDSSLEQLLANERVAVNAVRDSPDSREGMRAFMEKRDPVFNQ